MAQIGIGVVSKEGYSAIELLVVLAIASVVVTLGLVNYSSQIPHYALRDASRAVISDLRKIRQMAVTKGESFTIDFYPEDGENCDDAYGNQDAYCDSENPDQLRYVLPKHVQFGTLAEVDKKPNCPPSCSALPSNGISFQGDPPSATFNPNGTISGAGTVYLTNHPSRNEAVAITVNLTGRVKLWRWMDNAWE